MVDHLSLSPEARIRVQEDRFQDLNELYPGVLKYDPIAIHRLFENSEAVEFFATFQNLSDMSIELMRVPRFTGTCRSWSAWWFGVPTTSTDRSKRFTGR